MITQEDINTVLGAACYNLGYPVTNAAFYRDVVPAEVTDEMLKAECEKIKAEQLEAFTTPAAVDPVKALQDQVAALQSLLLTALSGK